MRWEQRYVFPHWMQAYVVAGFGRWRQASHTDCPALPTQARIGAEFYHHRRCLVIGKLVQVPCFSVNTPDMGVDMGIYFL